MTETEPTDAWTSPGHYQTRAERIAAQVAERWQEPEDVNGLATAVYCALVEEANLELRQILAQVGGQLDLAGRRIRRGEEAMTLDRATALRDAVQRASTIMETFLDRSAATRLTIRLDLDEFDVTGALQEHLMLHNLTAAVSFRGEPARVQGDRLKLVETLGHLVSRFYFASREHERVTVSVGVREDGVVEGFVGLSPSHLCAEVLMEEIRHPLAIEDVGIDVSYARAVFERHRGSLFVATAGDSATGFGFTLPLLPEGGE